MMYIYILILFVIILTLYLIYKYIYSIKSNPILIRDLVYGYHKNNESCEDNSDDNDENDSGQNNSYKYSINSEDIPDNNNKIFFGYSFWLYVDNIGGNGNWEGNFNREKVIINRDDSPSIYYRPIDNSLIINIKTGENNLEVFLINKAFNSQKWNNICVFLNNRNLDIYINGKMVRSYILKEVPRLSNNDIYIFDNGNIYAELSYLRYFSDLLNPLEVNRIYNNTKFRTKIINSTINSNVYPYPNFFWWLFPFRNYWV